MISINILRNKWVRSPLIRHAVICFFSLAAAAVRFRSPFSLRLCTRQLRGVASFSEHDRVDKMRIDRRTQCEKMHRETTNFVGSDLLGGRLERSNSTSTLRVSRTIYKSIGGDTTCIIAVRSTTRQSSMVRASSLSVLAVCNMNAHCST